MALEKEDKSSKQQPSAESIAKTEPKIKKPTIKKKRTRKAIDYYSFIRLRHNYEFFPGSDYSEYLEMAPHIREVIVRELKKRPLSNTQVNHLLEKINPDYSYALGYIFEVADCENHKNYSACKEAAQMITRGLEIRTKGTTEYWGLTSKLDRA